MSFHGNKNASSELSVSHFVESAQLLGDGEKQGAMIPLFVVSQNRCIAGFFLYSHIYDIYTNFSYLIHLINIM